MALVFSIWLAGSAPGAHASHPWHEAYGELVSTVELRADVGGKRMQGLMELLVVEAGRELAGDDLRKSLRNLQASGLVGRAEAALIREAEGVHVVFSVSSSLQVASVEIVGNDCLRDSQLRGVLPQRPQTPLSESRVIRGVYRLQDLLSDSGFLERRVAPGFEFDHKEKLVHIAYNVWCGEPTLVEKVTLEGSLEPFTSDELLTQFRMTAGKRFQRSKWPEETERLEAWLGRRGFLSAEVGRPTETRNLDRRTVALTYPISVGPKLDLRVTGLDVNVLRKRDLLQALENERLK